MNSEEKARITYIKKIGESEIEFGFSNSTTRIIHYTDKVHRDTAFRYMETFKPEEGITVCRTPR